MERLARWPGGWRTAITRPAARSARDEVGQLAHALNEMAARVNGTWPSCVKRPGASSLRTT
ncbi:MAG: HAMP domain-containing protein [Ruthenibacterium lactatiformans]